MSDINQDDWDVEIDEPLVMTRTITPAGKEPRTIYYQDAYLNVGKKNPIEFQIAVNSVNAGFVKGRYKFTRRNVLLGVNEYGGLNLKREFMYGDFPIVPVAQNALKAVFSNSVVQK